MKSFALSGCIYFFIISVSFGQSSIISLRTDGTILKNGQPFFPIGYYAEGFTTQQQYNYAVSRMNVGGFNTIYSEYNTINTADYNSFFDSCSLKGVYNIISFYQPSTAIDVPMTTFINTHKAKPSILLWGVADDANNVSVADITRKNNLAKSLDNNHLTYQSFFTTGIDSKVGLVDASAMQSYPIYVNGNIDRDWNLFREIVSKCHSNGKTSIANLQVYAWTGAGNRWPTAAELDVQTYLATAVGFKGILYYTFKDYRASPNSTVDITHPELWNTSIRYANEVNSTLRDALINGVRTSTGASDGTSVYYGKWLYNNEEYVVAVNASNSTRNIAVPVSGNIKSSLFSYRNSTLDILNGNLSGTLGAMEVQIYKVTSVQTGPFRWYGNLVSTSNSNKFQAYKLIDGNRSTASDDLWLKGGDVSSGDDIANAYEAAGIIFSTARNINKIEFVNGSYSGGTSDGAFTQDVKVQTTVDGLVWTDATGWSVAPAYSYGNSSIGGAIFIFTGNASNILGIRVTGKVRTCTSGCSWEASAREFTASFVGDLQAPAIPLNLQANTITPSGFQVTWSPSTDNVGVAGYDVFTDGILLNSVTDTFTTIAGLECAKSYEITVRAKDAAGNLSLKSAPVTVQTSKCAYQEIGVGHRWFGNLVSTSNNNKTLEARFTDGSFIHTNSNIWLKGGLSYSGEIANGYEAAGLIFASTTTINRFEYTNGSYTGGSDDGAFTDDIKIQISSDGVVWSDAANWNVTPAYVFGSPSIGGNKFIFSSSIDVQVKGIRLSGKVRTCTTGCSFEASAREVRAYNFPDTIPPSIPPGLKTLVITDNNIIISWLPSSDNKSVTGYEILKNGLVIGTTTDTTFNITGLIGLTAYSLTIKAFDLAGNKSVESAVLSVTTKSSNTGGSAIQFFPLPATNHLIIKNVPTDSKITIITLDGKLMNRLKGTGQTIELDIRRWVRGMYIIQIETSTETVIKKIAVVNE
jgi:chitodextrinase